KLVSNRILMGEIKKYIKENLIIGVLSTLPDAENALFEELQKLYGEADLITDPLNFKWTSYYDKEMGDSIRRRFLSFKRLIDPSELSLIKHATNDIEQKYVVGEGRKINLDPGLLDLNRLILATTKNVGHRIPLQDGIYGEVTLIYMKKEFHALDWTYPDYQSPEYISILEKIRSLYKEKLKQK
ncbi:MAG: DUF4416 family protein, partial [Spirochaetales bacterium]|nr:DUF4416 family protein [Spirochaetales bacterium]